MTPALQTSIERERFYEVDKMIFDQKLFSGHYEYEADPDEYEGQISAEFFQTDREFFEHFRNCKALYLKLSQKVDITNSVMDKSYNQVHSIESLMRFLILNYE